MVVKLRASKNTLTAHSLGVMQHDSRSWADVELFPLNIFHQIKLTSSPLEIIDAPNSKFIFQTHHRFQNIIV